MELRQGILHQTTIQDAKEQRTYQNTSIAGNKRSLPEHTTPQVPPAQRSAFQRASSLSRGVPRLTASAVELPDPTSQDEPVLSEYTQHKAISATPGASKDRSLLPSHPRYALPEILVKNLAGLGIKEIYPWQKHCLVGSGLLNGSRNLVYTAPTGGGKSLVADVLMLKRVLEDRNAKALLVLPYIALVQEKVRWLRNVVQDISRRELNGSTEEKEQDLWRRRAEQDTIRVIGFFGGGKIRATWADFDIGVCTFEKVRLQILAPSRG
jgi:ATP-dependent helicase YprA (DUF1998 family)